MKIGRYFNYIKVTIVGAHILSVLRSTQFIFDIRNTFSVCSGGDANLRPFMPEKTTVYIDQHAADILSAATEAVEKILARRRRLDAEGRSAEPLVVLAGESHTACAQQMFHMLVIDGLRKAEPVAVAEECQHDVLPVTYESLTGKPPAPSVVKALKQMDLTGQQSLNAWISGWGTPFADHSSQTLHDFLLRNDIPTRFVDVSHRPYDPCMDHRDPSTAQSLRNCFGRARKGIPTASDAGVAVRNDHMSSGVVALAKDTLSRIAYLKCGAAHVAGVTTSTLPPQHSVARMLKDKGVPVLAMPLLSPDFSRASLPPHHGLAAEEMHIVEGLPQLTACYDNASGLPMPDARISTDIDSRVMEAKYLEALLTYLGRPNDILTVDGFLQRRANYPATEGKAIAALRPTVREQVKGKIMKSVRFGQ